MTRAALALAVLLASGCGVYSIGYRAAGDIEAVAVPIFENRTLRRGLEYNLTTHLRRRILDQTPLHLAREGDAPALRGAILTVTEGVVVPNQDDTAPPVESQVTLTVQVSLVSPGKGGRILVGADTDGDGEPDAPALISETESFVPQLAQSRESASDRALRKIAERIVDLIERDWGGAQVR